jgi:hypothetical protein
LQLRNGKLGRKRPMTDVWEKRKNKEYLKFEGIVGRMARKQKTCPCHFDQREKSFKYEKLGRKRPMTDDRCLGLEKE